MKPKVRDLQLGRLGCTCYSKSKANSLVAKFLQNAQLEASPSPSTLCPNPVLAGRAEKQEKPTCCNPHTSELGGTVSVDLVL